MNFSLLYNNCVMFVHFYKNKVWLKLECNLGFNNPIQYLECNLGFNNPIQYLFIGFEF